jgi:uncharacterized protein (DUF1800 family)
MPKGLLDPLRADRFDYWAAQHLLNRAGFGGTPAQVRAVADLGLDDAVDHLVEFESIDVPDVRAETFDRNLMRPSTPAEREARNRARSDGNEAVLEEFRRERQRRQQADRRQMGDLQSWWLRRLIESPRPLEEKMTLFWHGHFATNYRGIEDSYHMFLQNQLFRSFATGDVKDLTHAIIRDPAMLRYLNNDQNRRQAPNENLARELMELFTMGEGNVYTESDIKEGARALTGWTAIDDTFIDLTSRAYANSHDHTVKRILGASGNMDGDDLVDLIYSKDVTSEFLSWKLYRFFVNDRPGKPSERERAFIQRLALELRRSGFRIGPLLGKLFRSEHFYASANVGASIKSPVQLTVQAIRSLGTPARDTRSLLNAMDLMGQNLFYPPSVKGWDGGRSWINTSTLFVRHNLLVYLLTGHRPDAYAWQMVGEPADLTHLVAHLADEDGAHDSAAAVRYLLRFSHGRGPTDARVEQLVAFVGEQGSELDEHMLIALMSLITAMPEYQLC